MKRKWEGGHTPGGRKKGKQEGETQAQAQEKKTQKETQNTKHKTQKNVLVKKALHALPCDHKHKRKYGGRKASHTLRKYYKLGEK